MDHFRNSYNQNTFGQSNWYGNTGAQFSSGPLGRSNPMQLRNSGWNGWSYSGCHQPQQIKQQDNSVRYVQLNWNDILGSNQQFPVTTSGTSAFQLSQPTGPNYMPQGKAQNQDEDQGQYQQQQKQQATPPRVTVSLGNHGDNAHGASGNSSSRYNNETISPQIPAQFPGGGDQVAINSDAEAETNTTPSQMAAVVIKENKYHLCGSCEACKFQQARKSSTPFKSYLIRNDRLKK